MGDLDVVIGKRGVSGAPGVVAAMTAGSPSPTTRTGPTC